MKVSLTSPPLLRGDCEIGCNNRFQPNARQQAPVTLADEKSAPKRRGGEVRGDPKQYTTYAILNLLSREETNTWGEENY